MQVSEIIGRVRATISDEDKTTVSDRELIGWINDAIFELSRVLEYKQKNSKADVVAGINEYELSEDMIKIYGVKFKDYTLDSINYNEWISSVSSEVTGTPQFFAVFGVSIWLHPTPNENITDGLQVFYLGNPNKVFSVADFPDLPIEYHNRIVEYCTEQAYLKDAQFTAAQMVRGKYDITVMSQTRVRDGYEYPHIRIEPE